MSNHVPPASPVNPPSKKGSKLLLWSLAGLGGLLIVGAILAFTGGHYYFDKAGVTSPDKVTVEGEEEKEEGEESDASDVRSTEGSASFGPGSGATIPDWIPEYPDAEITGNFHLQNDKTDTGSYSFTARDSLEKVISFYEDGLKKTGLKVTTSLMRQGGKVAFGTAAGESADRKLSAYINVQALDAGSRVTVTFRIKK